MLILRDFTFYSFLFLFRLISRTEGVVWRGGMTNLVCSFRIVWRQGARHSWWTQGGDGILARKVPGGLAWRTWLDYSCHKLMPPPGGCFVFLSACYVPFVIFSLVLCLLLFLQAVMFLLFVSFFFRSFFFKCSWRNRLRGAGGSTDCFFYFLLSCCFFLSFGLSLFLFLFDLPFVSPLHRMCMSCLSYLVWWYLVWWHGIALPAAVLTAYQYVAT